MTRKSRRELLKAGAALAATPLVPATAMAPRRNTQGRAVQERARRGATPSRHIILKGGTIVSLDRQVGNFESGDILIEGKKIVGVAASLQAPGAHVIDASGTIVIPGFVDAHRHSW